MYIIICSLNKTFQKLKNLIKNNNNFGGILIKHIKLLSFSVYSFVSTFLRNNYFYLYDFFKVFSFLNNKWYV